MAHQNHTANLFDHFLKIAPGANKRRLSGFCPGVGYNPRVCSGSAHKNYSTTRLYLNFKNEAY